MAIPHAPDFGKIRANQILVVRRVQQNDIRPFFGFNDQPHRLRIGFDLFPLLGIGKSFQHVVQRASLRPLRQDRRHKRVVPVMGDHIKGNIRVMPPRQFDHFEGVFHRIIRRAEFWLNMADL